MGHSGWAFTFVSAAAGLTAATLVATPAQAATDCFPRAARALYSPATRALPVAALRPPVGGEAAEVAATPRAQAAPWHRPVAHHGVHHAHHAWRPHPGLTHTPRRVARAAAPQAGPVLEAAGVDASAVAGIPAHAPSTACGTTPAAPPIGVGPVIAAQPAPVLQGPVLAPEMAPIGTAVDTGATTPDTDTDTTILFPPPAVLPDYPPDTVVVTGPGSTTPGGPPPGGVPEPASWALMIAGLFGLGAALRFQRRGGNFAIDI